MSVSYSIVIVPLLLLITSTIARDESQTHTTGGADEDENPPMAKGPGGCGRAEHSAQSRLRTRRDRRAAGGSHRRAQHPRQPSRTRKILARKQASSGSV